MGIRVDTKGKIDHLAQPETVDKVVLLYSGGLDTSCMVKYIQDNYQAEVVTLTFDLGQPGIDLQQVKNKALNLEASEAYVVDARKEFASSYVAKGIKANALYQGEYPLSTAMARYLKCKKAVEVAEKEEADAIAHGATGKGNDQVRFEAGMLSLDPQIQILAPVREWEMSRDKEIEYAKEHGIPVQADGESPYSTDENLWGKSSECGILEFPEEEPPQDVFQFVQPRL